MTSYLTSNGINRTTEFRAMKLLEKPMRTLASPNLQDPHGNIVPGLGLPIGKTTLGGYRMGSSDESSGAIFTGEIFPPNPRKAPGRPAVTFENTGNNVFQPDDKSAALQALIKRLGDNKFKAKENEPYAAYQAIKKLEREVLDINRSANLEDQNLSREIVRNVVEERRQQNEDDYLRRMLDSGLSVEDAKDEIDNVRRNRLIQEAKTVEDRPYQAKLLLTNLAKKRGISSAINEPLSQSGAIMSPQPNAQIASAQGNPADGFGNAPLDVNRLFMTPEYFRSRLRRSNLTQESADRDSALNALIASGEQPNISSAPVYSARQREQQIEATREGISANAEVLRLHGQKLMAPLPIPVFCDGLMKALYTYIGKTSGASVRSATKAIGNMNKVQLVVGINIALNNNASFSDLKTFLEGKKNNGIIDVTDELLIEALQTLAGAPILSVPVLDGVSFRNISTQQQLNAAVLAFANASPQTLNELRVRRGRGDTRRNRPAAPAAPAAPARRRPAPPAPEPEPPAPPPQPAAISIGAMTKAQLRPLLQANRLNVTGNLQALRDRLIAFRTPDGRQLYTP
jgi:hypothetical protein